MARNLREIKEHIKANANKKSYFVKWYVNSKDKSKEDYDNNCRHNSLVEYDHAMGEWLLEEDVQEAIKSYLKAQRAVKMLEIYNSMYQKAIEKGDVNSAKWCEQFFKSDFFESGQDEINNYLEGIDIPALGGGN